LEARLERAQGGSGMPGERILVMDDEPATTELCTRTLTRSGYVVQGTTSGLDTLALLEKEQFDLLVVDIRMPDVDGLSVLRRGLELHPDMAAVVMTSHATLDATIEALHAGARGFVLKPFSLDVFRLAVRDALAQRLKDQERLRLRAQLPILQVTQALTVEGGTYTIARRLVETMAEEMDLDQAALILLDDKSGELSIVGSIGLPVPETGAAKVTQGIAQRVLQGDEPLVLDGGAGLEPSWQALAGDVGVAAAVLVPLRAGKEGLGLLYLSRLTGRPAFTASELNLLSILGSHIATAMENLRLYEQLRAGRNRLQALSRRLMEVQEIERRHIARELHDEIGQILTAMKLLLDMAANMPAESGASHLRDAQDLVSQLMDRVDALSLDLRPAMLDDLGLLPALLWHFQRYTVQTQVQVDFTHAGIGRRFPPEIETGVYRIIQEALTNVARHAKVNEVTVRLWADEGILSVQVEDHGAGFVYDSGTASGTSSGLTGMHERAVLLGGRLTVESAPGAGTRLAAELPLQGILERRSHERRHSAGR
jgi:signal transduction histidine kinase